MDQWYLRFGQTNVKECDQNKPVDVMVYPHGLSMHPDLAGRPLAFQLPLTYDRMLQEAFSKRRPQLDGTLEWLRLDPRNNRAFFNAMMRSPNFGKTYRSYYEVARIMNVRVTNTMPESAPKAEEHVKKVQLETINYAKTYLEWLNEETESMKKVIPAMEKELELGANIDRSLHRREFIAKGHLNPGRQAKGGVSEFHF